MLHIFFGDYKGKNYIFDPDTYFDNAYEDEWLNDSLSKEMVRDIDRSELVGPNLVQSPVLGAIPPSRLSGGVKTLILINNDRDHIFNASACGENCAAWLLKLGGMKDVTIRLGYLMHFSDDTFEIEIINTGKIVRNQAEFVREIISQRLLEDSCI